MKKVSKNGFLAGVALLLTGFGMPASAMVINFDDIANPGCCTTDPTYKGFTWGGGSGTNSWIIGEESANVFAGVEAHSGQNYAWSNGGTDLTLSNGLFDLNGLWARGASGFTATARGFSAGIEMFTQAFTVTDVYAEFSFNFIGIDSFAITDQGGNNILIDDISVNESTVSMPATLAMFGLGLAMFGLRGRKQ